MFSPKNVSQNFYRFVYKSLVCRFVYITLLFFLNFKYVNLELLVTYVNLEALNCLLKKIIVLRNEKYNYENLIL